MDSFTGLVDGFRSRSGELGFLDRLDDVRNRLIGFAIVLTIATVGGFYLAMNYGVLAFITAPIQPYLGGGRLKYLSPVDPFFITLKLAISIGFLVSLPYIAFQVWAVVRPLLLPDERNLMSRAIVASVVLFLVGAGFCYLTVVPLMLQFTMGYQTASLEQAVVISEYLKVVLRMLFAFGLAFELPIVVLMLTLLGVVTPDQLVARRRHALAILVVLSAIITPPDIASQVLLSVPVWILYEISIVISRGVLSRRAQSLAAAEL